tara:strand:+ start:260 stop:421 length:162 start_codon:yes stop_codon:yes gene_type:complete
MSDPQFKKTLQAIEDIEHFLSESQLYGLNMVKIDSVQEKITNLKKLFIEEVRD